MPRLSSGLVIAGAYAYKIRRTAFAQLRNAVKEGTIRSGDVAYAVAQLNRLLYSILVESLRVDKGDVVRIVVDYELTPGKINWKLDTLKIEVFKRFPDEDVRKVVESKLAIAEAIMTGIVEYSIEKIGETDDGDVVLAVKLGGREVGAAVLTPINQEFAYLKRAAVMEPSPLIVEKQRIPLNGKTVEEAMKSSVSVLTTAAKYVGDEEARRLYESIKRRVIPTAVVEAVREEE
ncbi:MAG: DUF2258 domain-containing protein [Sulfolobales archaeon]|nr:DUF2258 domain-containing protein [Sulfolobales archaeon]MCX8208337.1 DUF2258 domain-containing protein [Sulfolobales archaeon]MDW8011058.1 DUF2258 domain-containing protein [Sulfolobales archaeon]